MTPHDRPLQHPNAAWREVEGEVVIISPEDSVLHELNETASFLWKLSTGERTTAEIARRMEEEYAVDGPTALADACELLTHLEAKELLVCAEAP